MFANILASGYMMTENVVKQAQDFDTKHGVSAKFKEATEKAKAGGNKSGFIFQC